MVTQAGILDQAAEDRSTDLRRELAHVNEQCPVAHAMRQDWRQRCLQAEEECRRWEAKYRNLKRRKGLEHEPDEADETSVDFNAMSRIGVVN
jgi:hypothetical protein